MFAVSIPEGAIEGADAIIRLLDIAAFQYPKVRLKANLVRGAWLGQNVFQYPKVRLKDVLPPAILRWPYAVSIPEGAIEGAGVLSRKTAIDQFQYPKVRLKENSTTPFL